MMKTIVLLAIVAMLGKLSHTLILRFTPVEKIKAMGQYQKVSKDNAFLAKLIGHLIQALKGGK